MDMRALSGLIVVILLATACSTGPGPTPAAVQSEGPVSTSAQGTILVSTPTTSAVPSPSAGLPATLEPSGSGSTIVVSANIAYEASNPWRDAPEALDVYSPSTGGPYPVVVMFHGSPASNSKSTLTTQARAFASLGAVVFMPNWGHFGQAWPDYERFVYTNGQVACAVAFAREHASEYAGDPSRMMVFGHSGGGSAAVGVAFNRPSPNSNCLGGSDLGAISALAAWDPDWLSLDPGWDTVIAADPRLYVLGTPWQHIAEHPDLPVALVTDGIVGPYVRDLSAPGAADAFFTPRDPSGDLRALVQELGFLDDGKFDIVEMQKFAAEFLRRQGNPVTLGVMPGTTHDRMSPEGMAVLLDAMKTLIDR